MDLWNGSLEEFVREASSGALSGAMVQQWVNYHRTVPATPEVRAWENSLRALAQALDPLDRGRVGVGLVAEGVDPGPTSMAGDASDSIAATGVAAEYHLPLSGKRLDVILAGEDLKRRKNAVVVELKQWSEAALEEAHSENVWVRGVEHPHPCQQALDYARWLRDYHSAFQREALSISACAYLHNLGLESEEGLRDSRFDELLRTSPLYANGQDSLLAEFVQNRVGLGDGVGLLKRITGGEFLPGPGVLESLEAVLRQERQWHLLDGQRLVYNAILSEIRRLQGRRGQSAVLVRGAPGTGKTVIAVQLLADALRLGLKAAHSTGGKAFTTTLRSRFPGAQDLFRWNMNLRKAPTQGLDLLLVDEAHRIRTTSDTRWTKKVERSGKPQVEELLDAAKVTVFLLDENQFVRPDEIGSSALIEHACRDRGIPLRSYDLAAQFRCAGSEAYIQWVDALLGFRAAPVSAWRHQYTFNLVNEPAALESSVQDAVAEGKRARMVAGFCWKWSDPLPAGGLVDDIVIGDWMRPWNAKASPRKSYTPKNHPYTLWADTAAGVGEVGCIYSAQGFEFDHVGVIWGPDLVWRETGWVARKEGSEDRPVRSSDRMLDLVRNAYRVLLTRGMRSTSLCCLDPETREHISAQLMSCC